MIDWLWLRVGVAAESRLAVGKVLAVNPDGDIEWQTSKWLSERGSHDGSMALRIDARGDLNISGSPAKFLQGHNLFGSNDIEALARAMIARALAVPGVVPSEATRLKLADGCVDVLRVDINESFATGSRARCHAWIREAANSATLAKRGRGLLDRETAQWGRGSRHWYPKAYCKGHEIEKKGHQLPEPLRTAEMLAYADDALRIEVQFNARYLKALHLDLLCNWQLGRPESLYTEHVAKLNFAGSMNTAPAALEALPRHLRQTFELWQRGGDLRALMSKMTFYRHRRELLELGVDIAGRVPQSNVVKLLTVIEARPKGIPDFAVGTSLYFEPRRSA